jgi:hypothetical protein
MSDQFFTAARYAAALGTTPQAVRNGLAQTVPTIQIVNGNEAATWPLVDLPESLRKRLAEEATRRGYRNTEDLLSDKPSKWLPPLPLDEIDPRDIDQAVKLRTALRTWLSQQHDQTLTTGEVETSGVADYARVFGHKISRRYWRELFLRVLRRDGGNENWDALEIYLPASPRAKKAPASVVSEALAEEFEEIESFIHTSGNPTRPTKYERQGLWALALKKYASLAAQIPGKRAARLVRSYLSARAPFLAANRDALLKAFKRKLRLVESANGDFKALADGRAKNGPKVTIPGQDVELLRHSAAVKNGSRVDAAWREEYDRLSEQTRHYPPSPQAPRTVHKLVGREKVDALYARHQGKQKLKRIIGGVTRKETRRSMEEMVMDDLTSNIESTDFAGGEWRLLLPQILAGMDSGSRKIIGWACSKDKGPSSGLVWDAAVDAFKRYGVPLRIGLENGWVFGRAVNINGKQDESGRTIIAGLAQCGCTVRHFQKHNPTSKSELEKAFDLLQCRMERHPGYTGRNQMLDAPEEFKREQRLIQSGKVEGTKYRYTFEQFLRVLDNIIKDYNNTPQHRSGHLNGLSPNEAFELLKDPGNPPIKYSAELQWLLNPRYTVRVAVGGVRVPYFGKRLEVSGGELVNYIGES